MIAQRPRESKRAKALRIARNIEKLKKEGKCRECSVVVTRMDFAKILGKFTKVKIQYESSSPTIQKNTENSSLKSNGRLKNNENGVSNLQTNKHHTSNKEGQKQKKSKTIPKFKDLSEPKNLTNNILKENNRLKKETTQKCKELNLNNILITSKMKHYTIIFSDPEVNNNHEVINELSLTDILPKVDNSILPSPEWHIDFFPKTGELKEDKVYDRIAAELEDLMRPEQPIIQNDGDNPMSNKTDDFPSIMDILNDNTNINNVEQKDHDTAIEFKANLDSSDVEAMLLGRTEDKKEAEPTLMDIDSSESNNVLENSVPAESKFNDDKEDEVKKDEEVPEMTMENVENPGSPSIPNEDLKNGAEEKSTDNISLSKENGTSNTISLGQDKDMPEEKELANGEGSTNMDSSIEIKNSSDQMLENNSILPLPITRVEGIMYVTFKKIVDGKCLKSVTCPKNLKYSIELDQKSVEFIGAPKNITTLNDLEVLLQIVNESELNSPYVLC